MNPEGHRRPVGELIPLTGASPRAALAAARAVLAGRRQARALTAAALSHVAVGAVDRAEASLAAAELLLAGTGQHLEIAYARHNRALVAFASGDLPGALRHLDDAAGRYADLGVFVPDAALDRCAVLLAAGFPADALPASRRPWRPRHRHQEGRAAAGRRPDRARRRSSRSGGRTVRDGTLHVHCAASRMVARSCHLRFAPRR